MLGGSTAPGRALGADFGLCKAATIRLDPAFVTSQVQRFRAKTTCSGFFLLFRVEVAESGALALTLVSEPLAGSTLCFAFC